MSPLPVDKGRRTLRWKVTNLDGLLLGFVEWHRPWRCYAFMPSQDTLFEKTCLRDLAAFCDDATAKHRQQAAASKANGRSGGPPPRVGPEP